MRLVVSLLQQKCRALNVTFYANFHDRKQNYAEMHSIAEFRTQTSNNHITTMRKGVTHILEE